MFHNRKSQCRKNLIVSLLGRSFWLQVVKHEWRDEEDCADTNNYD